MVDCADHERLAEAKVELDVSYLYGLHLYIDTQHGCIWLSLIGMVLMGEYMTFPVCRPY